MPESDHCTEGSREVKKNEKRPLDGSVRRSSVISLRAVSKECFKRKRIKNNIQIENAVAMGVNSICQIVEAKSKGKN